MLVMLVSSCKNWIYISYIILLGTSSSSSSYAFVNKPWKEDEDDDSYSLIVTTPFIFNNVPAGPDKTGPKVVRGSLGDV